MTNSAIIALAAAIAIAISTLGPSIGQGLTAKAAMESIARQPDAAKDIRSTLIISLALMEALTIYGLLIAFMLVSKIYGVDYEYTAISCSVDCNLLCSAYDYT